MMNLDNLTEGQKVFFKNEHLPMELISKSKRFAVVIRSLDINADFDLIYFEVERGAYNDVNYAYESIKEYPVYSLLDFKEMKKAPSNLVFNPYDFFSKEDCVRCIEELENGTHSLSIRHEDELLIDW